MSNAQDKIFKKYNYVSHYNYNAIPKTSRSIREICGCGRYFFEKNSSFKGVKRFVVIDSRNREIIATCGKLKYCLKIIELFNKEPKNE